MNLKILSGKYGSISPNTHWNDFQIHLFAASFFVPFFSFDCIVFFFLLQSVVFSTFCLLLFIAVVAIRVDGLEIGAVPTSKSTGDREEKMRKKNPIQMRCTVDWCAQRSNNHHHHHHSLLCSFVKYQNQLDSSLRSVPAIFKMHQTKDRDTEAWI